MPSPFTEKGAYTVQFNTKFIRAVKLPQVVLVQGRVVKKDGRKIFARGAIEDKDGKLKPNLYPKPKYKANFYSQETSWQRLMASGSRWARILEGVSFRKTNL